jgi:AraC-like DNA-binding protein
VTASRFAAPYHYHPELELTWIVRSSGHRFVGDSSQPFHHGDLVLLGPHVPHVWLNPASCRRAEAIVVQFLPTFLGETFFTVPELRPVQRLLSRASRALAFAPTTRKKVSPLLVALPEATGAARLLTLLQILVHLAGDRSARPLCSPRYAPQQDSTAGEKINAVYRHLAANFRETIFQSDLAKQLGSSPAAFSRFFRRATGRGFTETLNDIRLGEACQLLRESDRTIAEICYACGFENLANFNRQFRRRHAMNPSDWRHRARGG